jgi:hypothetical protein
MIICTQYNLGEKNHIFNFLKIIQLENMIQPPGYIVVRAVETKRSPWPGWAATKTQSLSLEVCAFK